MKSTREFHDLPLSPRNVRQYLASKILNEMTEKHGRTINEEDSLSSHFIDCGLSEKDDRIIRKDLKNIDVLDVRWMNMCNSMVIRLSNSTTDDKEGTLKKICEYLKNNGYVYCTSHFVFEVYIVAVGRDYDNLKRLYSKDLDFEIDPKFYNIGE